MHKLHHGALRPRPFRSMLRMTTASSHTAAVPPRHRHRLDIVGMAKPWRPTIDDVDSISRGGPAKVRGTGSRRIPHRLNAEERTLYDLAKKKGFLAVRGTAYRKFRHGNPLPNIYRQWCDARAQACVVVEQDQGGLRGTDYVVAERALLGLAAEAGLRQVSYQERPADALPFNILPPLDGLSVNDTELDGKNGVKMEEEEEEEDDKGLFEGDVAARGLTNQDLAVQDQVRVLLQLKMDLAHAEAAAQTAVLPPREPLGGLAPTASPSGDSQPPLAPNLAVGDLRDGGGDAVTAIQGEEGRLLESGHTASAVTAAAAAAAAAAAPRRSPLEDYYRLPIWQIHAVPLFFEGTRSAAKQFASKAVQRVAEAAPARKTVAEDVAPGGIAAVAAELTMKDSETAAAAAARWH
ncbi:hypothetical protein VOLCADRAFT_97465 [Volvox carteri f. nagariensis]|uniref:Uncharacterized protein n=1 Tax=Volvox carteri f. nagariensis TaxID=3068 RepID=D8UCU0_VOLCA|nr:uncharacterized protein VOLCADRAFT_97465 [Volvox carteri f. nagariensis]EFJ42448.1 hypothetical protein VOLCADRAFT_97465 [Volvox carteri f. nagariensis]|eukprot:XP_002956511.1 hypothetical protein VOLCADRAFT_97465 [Volvox carteri f. nagariensis]